MNLLATERITWTVPASAQARRLYSQWKSAIEEEQRQKIADKLPEVEQYRLELTSVTMTEEAKRENLLQSVVEWFQGEHGITPYQYNMWYFDTKISKRPTRVEYPQGDELADDEAATIFGVVRDIADWATLLVCLKKVEYRKTSMTDVGGAPWTQIDVPSEWKDYHTFRASFPRRLFSEAVKLCNDLNPGVWSLNLDEDSKNVGGVSVS